MPISKGVLKRKSDKARFKAIGNKLYKSQIITEVILINSDKFAFPVYLDLTDREIESGFELEDE